jgi:hypothetical protein
MERTPQEIRKQYYLDHKEHLSVLNNASAKRHYVANKQAILDRQRNKINPIYCECCMKNVKQKSWIMHLKGKSHRSRM